MPSPIIYINSWPGVGKRTIALQLLSRMPEETRFIHNHLQVDLVEAVIPRSSPVYQELRRELRQVVLETLTKEDTFDFTYIFTDFQTCTDLGKSAAKKYIEAAKQRGCPFIPIILTCREEQNVQRMMCSERVEMVKSGKGMLLDTEFLVAMRGRGEIYSFGVPEELRLDVSDLQPCEVAEKILNHLEVLGYLV